MAELKVYHCNEWHNEYTEFYMKSDVDKVIAEKDKVIDYARVLVREDIELIRHQKYKRCLAMAKEWRNYAAFCGMQSHCHNHRGFGKTADKYNWKESHAWKCVHRYNDLAEKIKEVK